MKLQEAISVRDTLKEKLELLNTRLLGNVRVPKGTKPMESPERLFKEIDADLRELTYIFHTHPQMFRYKKFCSPNRLK